MKNFKAYLQEGPMSQYPELGPATGVSQDQVRVVKDPTVPVIPAGAEIL